MIRSFRLFGCPEAGQTSGPARRRGLVAGLGLLALALGACSSDESPPPVCPAAVPVPGADTMTRFAGQGRDLTDVLFEARVERLDLVCDYDDGAIEAQMRVAIVAMLGPADPNRRADLNYFVAVATRDRKVLAREEFDLSIPFEGNRTRIRAVEEIAQRIPLQPGESGADYVVYVGLGLTPQELRYNLDNR